MGQYLLLDETKSQFLAREAGDEKTGYTVGDSYTVWTPVPNGDGTYSNGSGTTFSGNGGWYYMEDYNQPWSAVVITEQIVRGKRSGWDNYHDMRVVNFLDGTLCGYAYSFNAFCPIELAEYAFYFEIYSGDLDNLSIVGDINRVILLPWTDTEHVKSVTPGVAYTQDTKEVFYNGNVERGGYVKCIYYLGEEAGSEPKYVEFFENTEGSFGYPFVEYGVERMLIDGVEVEKATNYEFPATATGFHEVWFKVYSGMEPLITGPLNPFGNYHGGSYAYSIELPEGVEIIPEYFLFNGVVERIVIPSTVKWIAPSAFGKSAQGYGIPVALLPENFINHSSLNAKANNYWGAVLCDRKENDFLIKDGELYKFSYTTGDYTKKERILPSGPTMYGDELGEADPYGFYGGYMQKLVIPDSYKIIHKNAFRSSHSLSSLTIGSGMESIGSGAFMYTSNLQEITCHANTAPTITNDTFSDTKTGGVLHYPSGSDYSSWMRNENYYLGKYGWTSVGDA